MRVCQLRFLGFGCRTFTGITDRNSKRGLSFGADEAVLTGLGEVRQPSDPDTLLLSDRSRRIIDRRIGKEVRHYGKGN